MTKKFTLNKLAEEMIRESKRPFTINDFAKNLETRWQKQISDSSLKKVRQILLNHHSLIGIKENDFVPCRAVIEKINHVSLAVPLGTWELKQGMLIPGHRLMPFLLADRKEEDLTFVDADGNEIKKLKQTFFIQDVASFYQYCGNFPEEIKINEKVPGKSCMTVTAWDMGPYYKKFGTKPGDALLVDLVDYEKGVFQVRPYSASEMRSGRLRKRSFYLALATQMDPLSQDEKFCSEALDKQLLRVLFSLEAETLKNIEVFSVIDFLESLKEWTVVGREKGGVQLIPVWKSEPGPFVKSSQRRTIKGEMGTLNEIFQDLELSFDAQEFKSILYTVMSSDKYKLETVFFLLFGGQGELFKDKKQHEVFYGNLREMLFKICEDLKTKESILISGLREQCVDIKMSLVGIMRFLEDQEVGLEDLPADILNQIIELDQFCNDSLRRFSMREEPPELIFIRDLRVALKVVVPQLALLEEEIYSQIAIY
ncbi:MAG: hypothetical protein F3742_03370 [Nitrospinae bacterium]|nr:hypothetical protein [Nitrospinota bacterium]MZH13791.1 hypothetical protein [Nitrospinota bacterium]